MPFRPRPRSFSRRARVASALVALGAIAAASTAFVGAEPARAAETRTLTVTPATGLGDQVVLVQWSGFTPTVGLSNTVNILQCRANPQQIDADSNATTVDDCLTATPFPNQGNEVTTGVTQADHTGSAFIEILPAAQQPSLNCSETNPCSLVAYENDGTVPPADALPETKAVAPLSFRKSIDDCPEVTHFDVRAEGEASAAQAMYAWAANLCTADPKLILDYTELSSISGRQDFLNRLIDVGVTSIPPTSGELARFPTHPAFTYAPLDVSADVVAYNIVDPTNGKRVTDLTLSPRLLARVISDTTLPGSESDSTSFWADPELQALNPGHHWPSYGLSPPLLRAEQNADTYLTTDWIAHDAHAQAFLHGTDSCDPVATCAVPVNGQWKDVQYPTEIFENRDTADSAYVPIQGELPVVRKTFYGVKPGESPPTSPKLWGFIGLVDLQTAERYDLPMAKLVNGANVPVAPDAASIAAGFNAMKTNADGITRYPDFASTDPAAYPLVKVDYAMVPTAVPDSTLATNLKHLLGYIGGAGQSAMPPGYLPMPATLLAQDAAAAAKIKVASTTPTTIPTTAPPPTLGSLDSLGDGSGLGIGDGGGAGDESSTPPVDTTSGPTTTAPKSTDTTKAVRAATPVVAIAEAGERYGLPIVTLLALLAAVYPLGRRGRPFVKRGRAALRTRRRRHAAPPPTPPAPSSPSMTGATR